MGTAGLDGDGACCTISILCTDSAAGSRCGCGEADLDAHSFASNAGQGRAFEAGFAMSGQYSHKKRGGAYGTQDRL